MSGLGFRVYLIVFVFGLSNFGFGQDALVHSHEGPNHMFSIGTSNLLLNGIDLQYKVAPHFSVLLNAAYVPFSLPEEAFDDVPFGYDFSYLSFNIGARYYYESEALSKGPYLELQAGAAGLRMTLDSQRIQQNYVKRMRILSLSFYWGYRWTFFDNSLLYVDISTGLVGRATMHKSEDSIGNKNEYSLRPSVLLGIGVSF